MRIDWAALGIVTVVSVTATLLFVVLLSFGVRLVSVAKVNSNRGHRAAGPLSAGYAFLGCACLLVLFCLYLIVPQFHH
jgi:hypothetical protein